jgi:hypothetical protein
MLINDLLAWEEYRSPDFNAAKFRPMSVDPGFRLSRKLDYILDGQYAIEG